MSDFLDRIAKLSPKRLALLALELQRKLEARETQSREPVAIIGLGCRFPGGADGPDAYWRLLSEGRDAIREVPPNRWDIDAFYDADPQRLGKMSTRWGGFLDGIDQFDPLFFGIAPREAASMDPQQRLLLEVAWEALEHAGRAPDSLAKTQTGVFIGICGSDYYQMLMDSAAGASNTYLATGTTHSVASGRISYILGLQGPSVSIDTACSSSLVAIHLACLSLSNEECRMALAGGVNAILSPQATIALSTARMMAPDGRCKAFDAQANGFVRAEGCGIVVLKRLSDAMADGDRILAVIQGSAVNQDGRSSGLTAPNGPSQISVVREALRRAEVNPADVSYVEAHGTGTSLGDPIEVQALASALGGTRADGQPLLIGSVKTNIGHLEAAAGVAGLIKVVLSLQHEQLPAHLHLQRLNPHIPWAELPVRVTSEAQSWPAASRRIAGVSSFGFSGTNAHIVVADAPARTMQSGETTSRYPELCCISAKSPGALRQQAARLASYLAANPGVALGDVCFTLKEGRAHFSHRAAFSVTSVDELRRQLLNVAEDNGASAAVQGVVTANDVPEVAFLFTGQGSQYAGMGKSLYETAPVFKSAIERCAEALGGLLPNCTLTSLLHGPDSSRLNETQFTQPVLFALEYSLAELWISYGVRPSFLLGHSVGEYVAACLAGVMSLEAALQLIATRGRLMQALPSGGGMAAVLAGREVVERAVKKYPGALAIAALNGPENTVISGRVDALEAALANLEGQGLRTQRLPVSHAFHSPLIDPMLDDFEREAAAISYAPPRIGFVSNLTGKLVGGHEQLDAAYWRQHAREAVNFASGIRTLYDEGCRIFLEVGPSPVLLGMGRPCVPDASIAWLPTLRRGVEDWKQVTDSLAALYVRGAQIDWAGVDRGQRRRRLALPTYPFERQRYWIEDAERTRQAGVPGAGTASGDHPLLNASFESARGETLYPSRLSLQRQTFLQDHRVLGMYVLPAPVYLELVMGAARSYSRAPQVVLSKIEVMEPLIVGDDECEAQVILQRDAREGLSAEIFVRGAASEGNVWKRHATARIDLHDTDGNAVAMSVVDELRRTCPETDSRDFYARLQKVGVEFGPSFQGIESLWRRDREAAGRIRVPAVFSEGLAGYHFHPAIMDSCLQLLGASLPQADEDAKDNTYLMVGIERYLLKKSPDPAFWCYARIRGAEHRAEVLTGDIFLFDDSGNEIARLEGVHLKRARRDALLRNARNDLDKWLYEVQWIPASVGSRADRPPDDLSTTEDLVESTSSITEAQAAEHGLDVYQHLITDLEELATAYVGRALRSLGWSVAPGDEFSVESMAARLQIVPSQRRLFARLLEMLGEDGMLARTPVGWRVIRLPASAEPGALALAIRSRYPQFEGEVALLEVCGENLGGVLRGAVDAVQLLFPGGSMTAVEKLTQGSPAARVYNTLVQRIVQAAIASTGDRALRFLEIGAGTGGTTSSILPILPHEGTEYVFTDVSRLFLSRAEQKFAAYPFVRYELLDIESDPSTQGMEAHQFDVIVAANVLHATSDLRQTLVNARRLLAPSGLLILLEGMGPQRWVDLTFGLTEGWWKFTDHEVRSSHPLLPRAPWLQLLEETGFQNAAALPVLTEADTRYSRQAVLVAYGPNAAAVAKSDAELSIVKNSARRWILVGNGGGMASRLKQMLADAQRECVHVLPGPASMPDGSGNVALSPERPSDYDRLLGELATTPAGVTTEVIHFLSYDAAAGRGPETEAIGEIEREVETGCRSALYLAQALVRAQQAIKPRLWIVTCQAQPAGEPTGAIRVGQSALWGLGRTIANEHPEIWGGIVDVAPGDSNETAALIATELGRERREDQIAYRDGKRYLARLRRATPKPQGTGLRLQADKTYLVTGGTGGMGLKVAAWLAQKGARHLVLTGRSGVGRMSPTELQDLEQLNASVAVRTADAADENQMREVLSEIRRSTQPLAGVIHVAGIFDDRVLMGHDWTRFEKVLAPKVRGGWILHEMTKDISLDFFVLFSSGASFLAPVGLGNYAAGNAFLDALAHYRRRLGLPAVSINWGPWEKVGMAEAVGDRREDQWTQAGFATMTPTQGLAAMERLIETGAPQTGVLVIDWAKYVEWFGKSIPPLYLDLTRQPASTAAAHAVSSVSALEAMERALPAERKALLTDHVRLNVVEVLGFDASYQLDLEKGLFDLGMDSLTAVELKNRLQTTLGRSLPATLLFDYPNVQKLSDYIARDVLAWSQIPSDVPGPVAPAEDSNEHDALSEEQLARLLSQKLEQLR